MRSGILAGATSIFFGLAATLPAMAVPLACAVNEKGAWGWAWGGSSTDAAGKQAVEYCGGAANGCNIIGFGGDGSCD
jgi:hypothetical protein